jgi:aminoglycoside phosphotransferase (APT) family kinase protein
MKLIGTGRLSDVYEHNGQALKVHKDWVSIAQIQYEADISEKVAEVCRIAPKFYGMEKQDEKVVLKFENIQGKILSDVMKKKLLQLKKIARGMGKLHREIHQHTISGLKTTADKFEKSLLQYKDISTENLNKIMEFFNQNSDQNHLCHGDLHPENIMVDRNDKMRVIDWMDAYSGAPLSDVARTYYLLKHGTPPGDRTRFDQFVEKQAGELIGREYLKSYFEGQPIPVKDLNMWGLIIRIHRYGEGIEQEMQALEKAIAMGIKRLLEV